MVSAPIDIYISIYEPICTLGVPTRHARPITTIDHSVVILPWRRESFAHLQGVKSDRRECRPTEQITKMLVPCLLRARVYDYGGGVHIP